MEGGSSRGGGNGVLIEGTRDLSARSRSSQFEMEGRKERGVAERRPYGSGQRLGHSTICQAGTHRGVQERVTNKDLCVSHSSYNEVGHPGQVVVEQIEESQETRGPRGRAGVWSRLGAGGSASRL